MKLLPKRIRNELSAIKLARYYKDAKQGEMVLHDRPGGLFSIYCQVLGALMVSDNLDCALRLHFTSGDYRTPGCAEKGWWTQFFETDLHNFDRNQGGKTVELPEVKRTARFFHLGADLDRQLAFRLSERLAFRSEILEEADQFTVGNFSAGPVVGIHYRGTDKLFIEAERIPYPDVLGLLARFDPRIRFFVATDEKDFLDTLVEKFGERILFREQHLSQDGTPLHHFDASEERTGFVRGKDAIIDAIMLARCGGMIRTPSNLSLASTFLNPSIPAFVLKPDTMSRLRTDREIRLIESAALPT